MISFIEMLVPGSLPKCLVVVGGGHIGLKLGTAYHKLDTGVVVVET